MSDLAHRPERTDHARLDKSMQSQRSGASSTEPSECVGALEPGTHRSGVLIGMAACALSGGLMGFIAGFLLGLWF